MAFASSTTNTLKNLVKISFACNRQSALIVVATSAQSIAYLTPEGSSLVSEELGMETWLQDCAFSEVPAFYSLTEEST